MKSNLLPAVAELKERKTVNDTNAPINEREGNLKQAALEREIAESCQKAIEVLKNSPTMQRLKHKKF